MTVADIPGLCAVPGCPVTTPRNYCFGCRKDGSAKKATRSAYNRRYKAAHRDALRVYNRQLMRDRRRLKVVAKAHVLPASVDGRSYGGVQ